MAWLCGRRSPSSPSSGFSSSSTAEEVTDGIDASNLTAIVTGASSGVGAETARVLAMRGAQVVMAVRNVSAGEAVKESILKETSDARIHVLNLDLSSMASVRKFASDFQALNIPLNILINNAGIMACQFELSVDGIEMQFATNHIGHFLLTNLLLDAMKRTANETGKEGRIVNVSSVAHRFTYRGGILFDKLNDKSSYGAWQAYGQSKLANVLHAKELARKLQEEGMTITVNALHPGAIRTNLQRYQGVIGVLQAIFFFVSKSIPQKHKLTERNQGFKEDELLFEENLAPLVVGNLRSISLSNSSNEKPINKMPSIDLEIESIVCNATTPSSEHKEILSWIFQCLGGKKLKELLGTS